MKTEKHYTFRLDHPGIDLYAWDIEGFGYPKKMGRPRHN
jgi:hypothetical protein